LSDLPLDARISTLVREWTRDVRPRWPQVEAVVFRLRAHCTADRAALPWPNSPDVIADFHFRDRRGPDYLFASSAALMLRSLGHPTRLVAGIYAAPDAFDAQTQQTPLTAKDAHFWVEVLVGDRTWVAIEPTPGYDVLPPSRPWLRRVYAVALAWIGDHKTGLVAVGFLSLLVIRKRKTPTDRLMMLSWLCAPRRRWRAEALSALRLVERRMHLAGLKRPPNFTPKRWLRVTSPVMAPGMSADLNLVAAMASRAAYSSAPRPPKDERQLRTVCRRVALNCTFQQLRSKSSDSTRRNPHSCPSHH
jgi:hypothetical protein